MAGKVNLNDDEVLHSNQEAAKEHAANNILASVTHTGQKQLPPGSTEADNILCSLPLTSQPNKVNSDDNEIARDTFDIGDYLDFKDYVTTQLFIIKESTNQKFEALSLNQQLDHLSTSKEKELQEEVKKLQRENETLKTELMKIKQLEQEVSFLRDVDTHNKKMMNEMMEQKSQHSVETHVSWTHPKQVARLPEVIKKFKQSPSIPTKNYYAPLSYGHNSTLVENEISISESNIVPVDDSRQLKTKSNIEARRKSGLYFDKKPENNIIHSYRTRTVPGNGTYSQITRNGKRIMVVGDSMLKWVGGKKLSQEINNGVAFVKSFSGATAKDLKLYHVQPLLEKGGVDVAVIHAGVNSIPKQKHWVNGDEIEREELPEQIAEGIIDLAHECRNKGINDIFINSIVYGSRYSEKIKKTNDIIKRKCIENGYIFISNDFIGDNFIGDGLHFNALGTVAYRNNLASYINHHYENV